MVSLGHLFATTLIYHLSPFPSPRSLGSGGTGLLSSELGRVSGLYRPYVFSDAAGPYRTRALQGVVTMLTTFSLDLLSLSVASPVAFLYRIDLLWQPTSFFFTRTSACIVFLLGDSSMFCLQLRFLPSPLPAQVGLFWGLVLQ